jgi:membrane protease YdiL (CAAX protease family)
MVSINVIPLRIFAMCVIQLALMAAVYIVNNARDRLSFSAIWFSRRRIGRQMGWAAILFAVLAGLFVGLPALFGIRVEGERDALWFAIPYQMLFVGFSEEMIFRGFYLDRFIRITGNDTGAIVLSSLMFGAWHAIGPLVSGAGVPLAQMGFTTVIGAILAVGKTRGRDCSVLSCALAHGAYNSLIRVISVL